MVRKNYIHCNTQIRNFVVRFKFLNSKKTIIKIIQINTCGRIPATIESYLEDYFLSLLSPDSCGRKGIGPSADPLWPSALEH